MFFLFTGTSKRRRSQLGCTSTGAHSVDDKTYCYLFQATTHCIVLNAAATQRRWATSTLVATITGVPTSTTNVGAPTPTSAYRTSTAAAASFYRTPASSSAYIRTATTSSAVGRASSASSPGV